MGKRTLGEKAGSVLIIGNPKLLESEQPVRVCEGVADALALASRFSGTVIATMGDAGMKSQGLATWLSQAEVEIVIHADNDQPGQDAANRLRLAVMALGGRARAVLPARDKDAADTAAALCPFQNTKEVWPWFAESLQARHSWPYWEAQRQAAILMDETEGV